MTDLPTSRIDLKAVCPAPSPTVAKDDHSEGMSYLQSVPRRMVTLYLPLSIIVFVLLFPFYWMGLTAIKPDEQLLDLDKFNPFWTWNPTFKHIHKLLFESYYPWWLWNTMYVAVCATILSIIASVLAAYAIVRLRYRGAQWVGGADLPVLSGAAVDPVHSARHRRVPVRPVRLADGADPDLSDHPDPVLDLAADGLLQDHPVRAGRMRADRRRQPLADPDQDRAAAGDPRPDLGVHLLLHAVLERVHLRADLPAIDLRTRRCRSRSSTNSSTATSIAGAR